MWMKLEDISLREISLSSRTRYCMMSLSHEVSGTGKFKETESLLVVARG